MSTQRKPVQPLTPLAAALAGALGGCFSSAVVYPLDVAKTRIQASPLPSNSNAKGKKRLSMIAVLVRIFEKEGILGLYKGFGATMLNTFSMQYAYFFFYSLVRNTYFKHLSRKLPTGSKPAPLSTATELFLGAVAGALAQIFTIPVSVIATRQQVGRPGKLHEIGASWGSISEDEKDNDSFLAVGREIIEEEGVTGLWLGIKPGLVLTMNPAITYGVFERVKGIVLRAKAGDKMSPWMSFAVGALSKTLATVITYPYIMAKVRIQARGTDTVEERHGTIPSEHRNQHPKGRRRIGALDILIRVWKREGFFGWYQGMQAQIIKAVLAQALLFMSKEQFEQWAISLMLHAGRFRLKSSYPCFV